MRIETGQPYVFGPFALSLPDGWTADFLPEPGRHELVPPDGDFTILISGYERDAPVELADVRPEALDCAEVQLPSGLDGLTYDQPDEDLFVRFWMIRNGNAMIAVALTVDQEHLASALIPAQMVVSSIRPSQD
ncbi:MAG: hypothetical protein AAGJ28_03880 [Pseudomonadota bacterium]